jgi:hypothetical protein
MVFFNAETQRRERILKFLIDFLVRPTERLKKSDVHDSVHGLRHNNVSSDLYGCHEQEPPKDYACWGGVWIASENTRFVWRGCISGYTFEELTRSRNVTRSEAKGYLHSLILLFGSFPTLGDFWLTHRLRPLRYVTVLIITARKQS